MIKLSIPLEKKKGSLRKMTAEDLFVHCVSGYKTESKRTKLLKARKLVAADAAGYRKRVPTQSFASSKLPEDIDDDQMVKLYEYQLVRKEGAGRAYYDAILNHAVDDLCPYCGVQQVSTLDHYLPKSSYSTLVVAPENLIPCCMKCNHRKLDSVAASPEKAPIHSYLDEIPNEPWLHVELGAHLQATYYVDCPEGWDPLLCRRLENHVKDFKLKPMYRSMAAAEISASCFEWYSFLKLSEDALRFLISTRRMSIEQTGHNYWKAALYRALEENMDLLTAYLKKKYGNKQ